MTELKCYVASQLYQVLTQMSFVSVFWSKNQGWASKMAAEIRCFKTLNVLSYVACPKSPVTNTFYSERIAGTNNSNSCRIIGHIGTYFAVQNDTHFNNLTATVTLVTISRHDRSKSNYAKCFRNFYFSQSA